MAMPEPKLELVSELPEPEKHSVACQSCGGDVSFLRITTPEGMPDFIHPLDDYAWIGWSWSESDRKLSLVATCSRACLAEWWANPHLTGPEPEKGPSP